MTCLNRPSLLVPFHLRGRKVFAPASIFRSSGILISSNKGETHMVAISGSLSEMLSARSTLTILPKEMSSSLTETEMFQESLRNPIRSGRLDEERAQRIAIVMADHTRFCSPFIRELIASAEKKTDDIKIVSAHGAHLPSSPDFFQEVLGEDLYSHFENDIVLSSTQNPLSEYESIGETKGGTPVELNKELLDRDLVISSLNVQPHYFAGYEGGAKSLLPGCSSLKTIIANHSKVIGNRNARELKIDGNSVRNDINESSYLLSKVGIKHRIIDFTINRKQHVVGVGYGDPMAVHRYVAETYAKPIYAVNARPARFIVAIANGPGGKNLYQALKAAAFASNIAIKSANKKSIVFLFAGLQEGVGGDAFAHEMIRYGHLGGKEIIEDLRRRAKQNEITEASQKLDRLAIDEPKMELVVVAPEAPSEVELLLNETKYRFFRRWDEAFAATHVSNKKCITILPYGSSTVPFV